LHLTVEKEAEYFQCDICKAERTTAGGTAYSKGYLESIKRGIFRRKIKREIRVLSIERDFDAAKNLHQVKAVLEIPCIRCSNSLQSFETIASLDVGSIFQAFTCSECKSPLSILKSNYSRKEIDNEKDHIEILAFLKCLNTACRLQEFARKTVECHYTNILQRFQKLGEPINLASAGPGVESSDIFFLGESLKRLIKTSHDLSSFRAQFGSLIQSLHDLDHAMIKEALTQIGAPLNINYSQGEKAKICANIADVLKAGIGGVLGNVVGNFILRLLGGGMV
jgi:hypothetical protein